jgi:uncharacterized protein (DUF2236 family)
VHATEHGMFLRAHQRHGARPFTPERANQYLAEVAEVAHRLGAEWVPRSTDELEAYFRRMRPELYVGPQARDTLAFLEVGGFTTPAEGATYRVIAAAAKALLPRWARTMCGFQLPPVVGSLTRRLAVDPATEVLVQTSRWLMGEALPAQLANERMSGHLAAVA